MKMIGPIFIDLTVSYIWKDYRQIQCCAGNKEYHRENREGIRGHNLELEDGEVPQEVV